MGEKGAHHRQRALIVMFDEFQDEDHQQGTSGQEERMRTFAHYLDSKITD